MSAKEWIQGYGLLLRWQWLRVRLTLPVAAVLQVGIGLGTVIGFGYLMPEVNATSAAYLITGSATLSLITLGLLLVPQFVAVANADGSVNYMRSLPISHMAYLAADLTIWMAAGLPGVIVALIGGALLFGFPLQFNPLVVPAVLLIVLTATSVGEAIAMLTPKPQLIGALTNFIAYATFLFSPITFPIERLPNWLAMIHRILPVKYAADAIRGTLIPDFAGGLGLALGVLGAWCAVGLTVTYVVANRCQ